MRQKDLLCAPGCAPFRFPMPPRVPTVPAQSARLVRQAFEALARLSVDLEPLYRLLELRAEALEDLELRIPYALLDDVMEEAVRLSGDSSLGLHMATLPLAEPDDLAAHVLLTSATLQESFERGARYQRFWGDGDRFAVEEDARGVRMRFTPVGAPRPAHRHLAELALAQMLMGARMLTGASLLPQRVRFAHAAPEVTREHEALFGAPLVFSAGVNDIEFSLEDARRTLPHANAQLQSAFERQTEREVARLAPEYSFAKQVEHELIRRLSGGDYALEALARAKGMPARTFQRRLGAEGERYAALLERVRRELSARYLKQGRSIAEVSFLLGYQDPNAFHRAFRRWWKTSPERFREALAG